MATIQPEIIKGDKKYQTVTWANILVTDVGPSVAVSDFPDKTVQIIGVLGVGAIALQGSMDNVNFVDLTFDGNNPIQAIGMFYVWENPKFIRPVLTGGDGTTDLTIVLGMSRLV